MNSKNKLTLRAKSRVDAALNGAYEKLDRAVDRVTQRAQRNIDRIHQVKEDLRTSLDGGKFKANIMNQVVNSRKYLNASAEKQAAAKKLAQDQLAKYFG